METDKTVDTSTTANNNVDEANKEARKGKPQIVAKSVIAGEIEKFKVMSKDWWTAVSGESIILGTMNQIRVPYVVEKAKETGLIREEFAETSTPLKGLKILDVGCGGGFYAEALAKLGADVVGIDVTEEMILEAVVHQDSDKTLTNLEYKYISIEEFALDNAEAFDVLVCSEVAEHVNDPRSFVLECAKCLKFGGSIIMQTVSKTLLSKWIIIYFVEYVWGMLAKGSHDYELFITPEDMSDMLAAGEMEPDKAIDISATASNDVDKANKNEKPQLQAKSIIDLEVEKFRDMSQGWWSYSTRAYALYKMNQIRVPYVVEKAKEAGIIREEFAETATPLKGLKVLDVGCGGGLYAEPLAKLGADVVGIDVTEEMIAQARAHQALDKTLTNLEYKLTSIEEFALDNAEAFDVLVCSEVAEHVNDPKSFVLECAKCLKFGASMIMQTINKTLLAKWIIIYFLENIWRFMPKGLHEYELFIAPEDMSDMMAVGGCKTTEVRGMAMNPFTKNWFWIWNTQVMYSIHATKTKN